MAFGHRLAGVIFLFFRSNIFLGGGANFIFFIFLGLKYFLKEFCAQKFPEDLT